MTPKSAPSKRTTVRRVAKRAHYDRDVINAILDETLVCHVGFVHDGQPYVIPTICVRDGDLLYIHGSPASRMLTQLRAGAPVCVTATLLDGLVLARSAFHHSMNYRSVVVLGVAREVTDDDERRRVLTLLVDHVVPARSVDARAPNEKELRATTLLALALDEASAKIRTGPPQDDAEDLALPVWAGVLPLRLAAGSPQPAPDLRDPSHVPDYVACHPLRR